MCTMLESKITEFYSSQKKSSDQKLIFIADDKSLIFIKPYGKIITTNNTRKANTRQIKTGNCITIESVLRNKVDINISWYDVYGDEQNQKYTISTGSVIDL